MDKEHYLTNIFHYYNKNKEFIKIKDCSIISNFLFDKIEFFIVYKSGLFFICTSKDKELFSLWNKKEEENNEKIFSGEVISLFRKKYIKNKITKDKIDFFLENPIEYEKKYKKIKSK